MHARASDASFRLAPDFVAEDAHSFFCERSRDQRELDLTDARNRPDLPQGAGQERLPAAQHVLQQGGPFLHLHPGKQHAPGDGVENALGERRSDELAGLVYPEERGRL